jgi:iron complex outermembrane receptor protein
MYRIFYLLIIALAISVDGYAQQQITLSGQVSDSKTAQELPGAIIYFPDLKRGTATDSTGHYSISNLPKATLLVEVSYTGYKQVVRSINLSQTSVCNFTLSEAVAELGEVVITGLSKSAERNRTPAPITVIGTKQLKQITADNIIDAITSQPGISQISTGPGISKPVIRGLGYNRVVTVQDGIRQEGQQWGDEHGVEIDENDVDRVEILKGPASLAYGSDAMAGVINFLPAPTLPMGEISGNVMGNFQSNNGLISGSANLGGNSNGFIWNLRYSKKIAHAYKNKQDDYVFNSGFRQDNLSAMMGLNKSWGYAHFKFSSYGLNPGIIEGERDSATGNFLKPIALDDHSTGEIIAGEDDFKSYRPVVPYQKIKHYMLVSTNHFFIGQGTLKVLAGWQLDKRQEFEDVLHPDSYGLYFNMNTLNYDLRYNLNTKKDYEISFGVNGMYQHSVNKGVDFLIPDYALFDYGIFSLIKKNWDQWTVSGGLRFDIRNEHGDNLWLDSNGDRTYAPDNKATLLFTYFHQKYNGLSGSLGATYQINESLYTKFNLSKGYRAPNIAEISANGVHEGTVQYLIGNTKLKPEHSYQTDFALGINTLHVTGEIDLFYNQINNYILLQKLNSLTGGDSLREGYQTFKYASGNAHLYGGEITLDIHPHPLDWLHFENSFSLVESAQTGMADSLRYLPFTPAPKLRSEIRVDIKKTGRQLANTYISLSMDKYFYQNHVYSAFGTETPTPGYTLLNCGLGTDLLRNNHTLFTLILSVNNLTDVAYQSHLSRLKYLDPNLVTGRSGVFNMGRNFSIKILIPVNIKN